VHDQLRDKTEHKVALLDLFQYPTVRSLAEHLQRPARKLTDSGGLARGKLRLAARQGAVRNLSS
jgi:hypothetical protein